MPRSTASDLVLHCYLVTCLGVSGLQWVEVYWSTLKSQILTIASAWCLTFFACKWYSFASPSLRNIQIETYNDKGTCFCIQSSEIHSCLSLYIAAYLLVRGVTRYIIFFILHTYFSSKIIALRRFFSIQVLIFFLFLHKNISCRYSLEAPCPGASNEYPQHMFSWRNKKTSNLIPTLI